MKEGIKTTWWGGAMGKGGKEHAMFRPFTFALSVFLSIQLSYGLGLRAYVPFERGPLGLALLSHGPLLKYIC